MHAHPKNFSFSLESSLYGPYCKVRMAAKFARIHYLTIVQGAMLQTFYKLELKPKTILGLKGALQQILDDLPQTFATSSECMCFGLW